MLHFIFAGVSGGKTTEIMKRIKADAENEGNKTTLIVPEQFSFTCQKNILACIGPEKKTRVDVDSFTSLGERLIGKPALHERRRLSKSSAAVLMSMTLSELKGNLKLYGKHAEHRSTINSFLALSSEFKQNGVTTDRLKDAIATMEEGLLKTKLTDIAAVLSAYEQKLEGSYFNPDDLLTEVLYSAELDAYFNGRNVYIDSFRGFTAQEYEVISHILTVSKDVYISLCTKDDNDCNDITDLFAKTKNTASRIKAIAEKNNIAIDYIELPKFTQYSYPELAHLEKYIYAPVSKIFDGECNHIRLYSAPDIYAECEFVAACIKKLIKTNNYRCRDIAVIARDMTTYEGPLHSALKKYGIDIYEDYRKSADVSPIINIVSAAISAVAKNFDSDSVMRYLKTGLTGIDELDIARVENYCYMWKISGNKWLNDWDMSTEGFNELDEKQKQKSEEYLKKLNITREKIVTPLSKLKKALKGGVEGERAVSALWDFIDDTKLSESLKKMAKQLNNNGEIGAALELERMWKLLVDMLDEMHTLLSNEKITAEKLSNIFELMLSVQTVGNIPQGLDEVVIGSADRIRISAPKAAFIIGANEDVFPPAVTTSSSLTLKDRAKMEEMGISLSATGEWKLADEKIIAYSSVCCPKNILTVTCSKSSAGGDELAPCEFYNKIKFLFPTVKEYTALDLREMFLVEGVQPAFEQLAKSEPGTFKESLNEYFGSKEEYAGKLAALGRARGNRNYAIKNTETAKKLFGSRMMISPSRIETYYSCPFEYFCRYGIKANPRKRAELDSSQTGNINHHVLEKLISGYGRDKLLNMSEEELKKAVNDIMDEYLKNVLGSPEDERFNYLYDILRGSLFEIALRLINEFEQSDFIPVAFELPIGENEEIKPYIPEGSSGNIEIIGRIDRVDIAKDSGTTYLRVIDYKKKQKKFWLGDVMYGINMQMLIYLFTLWKNGNKKFGDNITPAGILYYNATTPIVSADSGDNEEKIAKERVESQLMTGLIVGDEKIVRLMEHDAQKQFVPAAVDKDGKLKGNIINIKALEKLKKKADSLIIQMADCLQSGKIEAVPAYAEGSTAPCKYCDYKKVCGYEEGIPSVEHEKNSANREKEIIQNLMEEGENENGME